VVLYVLMGISSAMVFLRRDKAPDAASRGIYYYLISLALNFSWSIIFFNLRSLLFAFIWLLFLMYFIIKTTISYYRVSRYIALLELPYLIWAAFALYLNLAIYLLN
jgi:tryptophan-rich sensory protein